MLDGEVRGPPPISWTFGSAGKGSLSAEWIAWPYRPPVTVPNSLARGHTGSGRPVQLTLCGRSRPHSRRVSTRIHVRQRSVANQSGASVSAAHLCTGIDRVAIPCECRRSDTVDANRRLCAPVRFARVRERCSPTGTDEPTQNDGSGAKLNTNATTAVTCRRVRRRLVTAHRTIRLHPIIAPDIALAPRPVSPDPARPNVGRRRSIRRCL